MKDIFSRRSMLAGMGTTAVYGSLASQLATLVQAGEATPAAGAPAAPELTLSTVFMGGAKTKFDLKKYETKHLPLLKKTYGDSVSRIEMRTANATARGVPTDIRVTTTIYIANLQEFVKQMSASSAAVNENLAEASTGPRNIQIDRLLVASGQPRAEVRENHQVMSTFYMDKPDATFDATYYTDVYIPKLRSYYGDNAIRRIEVFLGVPQGGAKPGIMASTHLFIRERDAYSTANGEAQTELMKTDTKYTNTIQMWAESKVTAIV